MNNAVIKKELNVEIAILRAFAVLIVIGYHFFPSYIPWGFVGVDIFFVISGFLMIQIWCGGSTVYEFYINRFKRIYPSLLILLVCLNSIGFIILLDDEFEKLLSSSIASLLQVQNVREYLQGGYFSDAVNFRPLLHIWSLSLEFQFYFLLPLLFVACKWFDYRRITLVLFVGLLSLIACMLATEFFDTDVYFFTPFRMWEFLAGGCCYFLLSRNPNNGVLKRFCLISTFFCIALTVLFVRSNGLYPGWLSIAPVLAAVFYILANQGKKLSENFLASVVYVASISYSLYLFHFPAVEFLKQIYGSPTVSQRLGALVLISVAAHVVDRRLVPFLLKIKYSVGILIVGTLATILMLTLIKDGLVNQRRMVMDLNPVQVAKNTFKVDYREDCNFLGLEDHREDRCRTKTRNGLAPNVVLLGDSQSNALTTVFDELALQEPVYGNYLQIGRGLCPGILGVGSQDCMIFTEKSIAYIEKLDPTIPVFLAGQWPLYLMSNDTSKTNQFRDGLDLTLKRIGANGRKVVFVYNVPLGALPRTCLARHPWSTVGNCNIPKDVADSRDGKYRELIDDILKKHGVLEYDPKLWMCSSLDCAVYSNGNIMYLDDSHISRQGGSELARRSADWFFKFFILH